ncbi:hypothetical protein [Limnohabitans sp.]|jgi:hypothetical protein|uniref:hypothetical protein n=1 Tax=Limnohabitans sp. TaxID=1907725 RepID=UPI00311DB9BC
MNAQKSLLSTLAFIVGALSASMVGWLQPVAAIEVKNSGSQPIERLDIDYRGIGDHHGLIAQNMKLGQSIKFQWATDSEASYRLSATFADGTVIKGGAGYISRGEMIREALNAESVKSQMPVPFTLGMLYEAQRDTTTAK